MSRWRTPLGLVLVMFGAIWFFQGIGLFGGSVMSGVLFWAIAGPVVTLVGVGLVAWDRLR